jgi:GntR family transcriptional regulator, transcriptional repressor for pyruvate dehydrogenase complex
VALQAEFGTLLWLAFGDDDSHELMVTNCNAVVDAIEARDREVARRTAEQRVADATARLIDYHLNQEP